MLEGDTGKEVGDITIRLGEKEEWKGRKRGERGGGRGGEEEERKGKGRKRRGRER